MNTQTQEALKIALEALETPSLSRGDPRLKAIQACKEALESQEQEPVLEIIDGQIFNSRLPIGFNGGLYTHPAPSWQGLSDDDILSIDGLDCVDENDLISFAHAIEAKLKEKNT